MPTVHYGDQDVHRRLCSKQTRIAKSPGMVGNARLATTLGKTRAPRQARDRLGPKFQAIARMQTKDKGMGLHVHPGLGPRGRFPFVCAECGKRVSYPTDSSCPKNVSETGRDVSKPARKKVWLPQQKAIQAKLQEF